MDRIVILGSGASGVHFALSLLRKGYNVVMLDVGHRGPERVNRGDSFDELKANLSDPASYFLGEDFEGVFYPDIKSEYYGIPPSQTYVFSDGDAFRIKSEGFSPLMSFAQGGLAQAWTGGTYPFNDEELRDFPFGYRDVEPYYAEVARRIGIAGTNDDLSRFMPVHDHLLDPLNLDFHSELLLSEYQRHKDFLNSRLRCYFGRSRVAALTQDRSGRPKCSYFGRCLWGCPTESFYTPSLTLRECREFGNFTYLSGVYGNHFKFDSRRHVKSIVTSSIDSGKKEEIPCDKLVLAGGTLSSSKIFLASIFQSTGETVKLPGLMDNRQVLVPFVNLKMIGRPFDAKTYQYHQVAIGIEGDGPQEYIHGLVTTLKTALVHPIIQKIPFDLRTGVRLFKNLHAALGLVNVNFSDTRRRDNYISLETEKNTDNPVAIVRYAPPEGEPLSIKKGIGKVRRALWTLKCLVPPGMIHVRPMGASVHYAGTLPMSKKNSPLTTSEMCASRDFENLYIVDGTTFPFLPSKNITFTLMANAVRVAENAF